ncbi:unnamed protein product [Danaus chrysippus]|uniref:(African queen) hypothetical protein n=1 Tax=Danaus chrysippus TaxID=151541 RepID=A0A8J2QXJ6_9NEOP|nr:unnamed protein product [Danaus chrysippus]
MEDNSLLDMVITTVGVIITMALLSCLCCLCMKLSDLKMQRYILEMANKNGVKIDLDKLDSKKPQPQEVNETCTIMIPDVAIIL